MMRSSVDDLKVQLWPASESSARRVFAVVDGARDPEIERLVRKSGLPAMCLFAGEMTPALAAAAPYLVHLERDSSLARTLLDTASGDAWCIYAVCDSGVPVQDVRKHFRSLLRVGHADDRRHVFRFYDPRVLSIYVPTCTPTEKARFFGPVSHFFCEGSEPGPLRCYFATGGAGAARQALHDDPRPGAPLLIRASQIDAFDDALAPELTGRLCQLLRTYQADDTSRLDDDALRALVVRSLGRARSHGLRWESSLGDFVSAAAAFGETFDTQAPVAALLDNDSIPRESRMKVVLATLTPQEWDVIRAACMDEI